MANDTTLDSQMLIAAQQAYNITDNGFFNGTTMPDGYLIDDRLDTSQRVNLGTGFKVVAFKKESALGNEYIIAFRGTDPTSPKDLYSDGQLGWNQWENDTTGPKGQTILNYINDVLASDPQATFHITGHSLGGGLAQYAAYYAKLEEKERQETDPSFHINLTLTTFNGFGVMDTLARRITSDPNGTDAAKAAIQATLGNMYAAHYIANGDLVGLLGGGHVGDVTNGTLNTYALGSATKFFIDAHFLTNNAFQNLSLAQSHNFSSEYLKLQTTQGALAYIESLGSGGGQVSDVGAALRLVAGLEATLRFGDSGEIDKLGDWIVNNLYASGKISSASSSLGTWINWGAQGETGGLIAISSSAVLVGATSVTEDTLTSLANWAGASTSALIDSVRADLNKFSEEVQTYLPGANRGLDDALAMDGWIGEGYNVADVLTQAQNYANLAVTSPNTLQSLVDTNPLSLLPTLTAPNPADYSDDPAGQMAYQTALDLYNNKQTERTQLQTLYNQYLTDTNNLTPLPIGTWGQAPPTAPTWTVPVTYTRVTQYGVTTTTTNPSTLPPTQTATELRLRVEFAGTTSNTNDNGTPDPADDITTTTTAENWIYRGPQTSMIGNTDNDVLTADAVTTFIDGAAGADVLDAQGIANLQIHGGADNDELDGGAFYTRQYYFLGQTAFEQQYGRVKPGPGSFLYGEQGNDHLVGSLHDDTLDGGADPDFIEAAVGDDTVLGGLGNDLANGLEGEDSLQGDDGDDLLGGGDSADHLIGGTGNDQLYGDSEYRVLAWDGTNLIEVYGTPGYGGSFPVVKDVLETQAGDDVLEGGDGTDQLYGGAGDDLLDGGAQNDHLQGEGGDDLLFGADGDDQLWGDSAADAVTSDAQLLPGDYGTYTYYWRERHSGLDGNDYLDGGAGNDQLWGGGGNDHLVGGAGSDYLAGGLYDGSVSGDDVLEGGSDNDFLFGEDGADTLRGDAGADELHGGSGDDGLFGGTESDHLWGDAGNDVLQGEAGDDFLYGNDGEDTIFGGDGIDQITGDAGRDVIYAGAGNDIIEGDSEDDLIFGELGDDSIDGGSGNDELYGGAGNNILAGGIGNDIIFGGPGNDTLQGGDGDDTIDGGGGNDTIYLSTGSDNYINIQSNGDYRIALDLTTPNNFQITLQDQGGLDHLTFENVFLSSGPAGSFYLRPSLESLTQEGNDLVIGLYLYSDINPAAVNIHGTVRLTGQYTNAGRIETIDGMRRKDNVFVTEAAASQVSGNYFVQSSYSPNSTTPDFQVLREDAVSISGIDTVLAVGGPEGGLLSSVFTNPGYGYVFYGHEGDDVMIGASRRDYFHGGPGNDRMEGKSDYDTYYVDPREADSVLDDATGGGNNDILNGSDTLVVPDGMAQADLPFRRQGDDLLIGNTRIERYFEQIFIDPTSGYGHPYQIEHLEGKDALGASWSVANLPAYLDLLPNLQAEIVGTAGIDGLIGDQHINRIYGAGDDDGLSGGGDNDVLAGGTGNDQLYGDAGSDVYLFNPGDSDAINGDYISDYPYDSSRNFNPADKDTLSFGGGIQPQNIDAYLDHFDNGGGAYFESLMLKVHGSGEIIWSDWLEVFDSGAGLVTNDYRLERMQFLGSGNDRIFDLAGLVNARRSALLAATEQNPIPLFRTQDLTTYNITATVGLAGGEYALNYATTGNFSAITPTTINGTNAAETLLGTYSLDNLYGLDGNDTLYGNTGNDTLDGGPGADIMLGGPGNDIYVVENIADDVRELPNEGTDTVQSSVTYTLTSNVENLTLTGASAINGTGNGLSNTLTGNSAANMLDGGTGADTLIGDDGDDTYIIDNAGDSVMENANQGTDTVHSNVTYILGNDVENLTLTGSVAINGTGNALNNILDGSQNIAANALVGGLGNDTYIIDANDIVAESLNEGMDTVQSGLSYTLGANFENLVLTGSAAVSGIGNTLNNTLAGNSADNFLDGSLGADIMAGGLGNDTYVVDDSGDTVVENANEGTDTVLSSITHALGANVENLMLTGTAAANGTGNSLDNVITGNGANNTIDGGTGDDTLYGGAGDDAYIIRPNDGFDVIEDTSGNDQVQFQAGINPSDIRALRYGDQGLFSGNNLMLSSNNVDISEQIVFPNWYLGEKIESFTFAGGVQMTAAELLAPRYSMTYDPLFGYGVSISGPESYLSTAGGGDGTISGTEAADILKGWAIAINGYGGDDSLFGDVGNDVLNGGAGNDKLVGDNGDDSLNGGLGAETMFGGAGNDTYVVDDAGDSVSENVNEGTDTVQSSITYTLGANVENLTLTGTIAIDGTGNELDNVMTGNDTGNWLYGLAGNDTLHAGGGSDWLYGGAGNDTLNGGPTGSGFSGNWLYGGTGDDTLIGGSKVLNYLDGGDGNDTLTATGGYYNTLMGGAGDDHLIGSDTGLDYLDGGTGNNLMEGRGGNDTYAVRSVGDTVTENANEGTDGVQSYITYTLGANVENLGLMSSTGALNGTGNELDNVVDGNESDNILTGLAGNDTIHGYVGNDILDGGVGNDILYGGTGNDTYRFGIGYGRDAVTDNDTTAGNTDTVNAGMNPLSLVFSQSGNNLLMSLHGTTDQLTVASWYAGTANQTEIFKGADNSTLANTQVDQLIQAMAQFSASHGGITWDQAIDQNPTEVQAVISAYWQPGA